VITDKRDTEQPRARTHDMDKGQGVERESGGNKMWRKLQVAKDGQGVYKSSKVRMKIAPSFLSVIYTIPTVWFYK